MFPTEQTLPKHYQVCACPPIFWVPPPYRRLLCKSMRIRRAGSLGEEEMRVYRQSLPLVHFHDTAFLGLEALGNVTSSCARPVCKLQDYRTSHSDSYPNYHTDPNSHSGSTNEKKKIRGVKSHDEIKAVFNGISESALQPLMMFVCVWASIPPE